MHAARKQQFSDAIMRQWGLGVAIAAVGIIRLLLCIQLPNASSDLLRNMLWGLHLNCGGIACAAKPLVALDPTLADLPFAENPYNYPPVAMAFFCGCAALRPCLLLPKLVLTVIEAVNALLLARIAGRKWIGVLYWAAPLSIWAASREGQFEPIQNLFVLLSVAAFRRHPALAFGLAGLAAQTKVLGGAILIYMIWEILRTWPRFVPACFAALAVSFLPCLVAQIHYPSIQQIATYTTEVRQNPVYWIFSDASLHGVYRPTWVAYSQAISWALLGLMVWEHRGGLPAWNFLPAAAAIVYFKTTTNFMPWYWLVVPALASPTARGRAFAIICLMAGSADFAAMAYLTGAPGPYDPGLYRGLEAWSDIRSVF